MKKALSIVLALLMLLAMIPASLAQETAPVVYVTIADQGLKLVQRPIVLHDTDNDGVLTIADALYLAHEEGYEGGAAAGFATQMGDYGLSITRLWGEENGGAYGYYVNNQMSMGLTDTLNAGDYVTAYVYTDTTGWSDTYTYFDVNTAEPGEITLTLSAVGFDPVSYAPVSTPVAGASITVNGNAVDVVTDENGEASVSVKAGDVVSATSEKLVIVPPCCVIIADATGLCTPQAYPVKSPAKGAFSPFCWGFFCLFPAHVLIQKAFLSPRVSTLSCPRSNPQPERTVCNPG